VCVTQLLKLGENDNRWYAVAGRKGDDTSKSKNNHHPISGNPYFLSLKQGIRMFGSSNFLTIYFIFNLLASVRAASSNLFSAFARREQAEAALEPASVKIPSRACAK
jgi:hypothetical protein